MNVIEMLKPGLPQIRVHNRKLSLIGLGHGVLTTGQTDLQCRLIFGPDCVCTDFDSVYVFVVLAVPTDQELNSKISK